MTNDNNNNDDDRRRGIRIKTDIELLIEQEKDYRDWHFAAENEGKKIKCWDCHKEAEIDSIYGNQYTMILVHRAEGDQLTNTQFFFRCPQCNSDLRKVVVVSTSREEEEGGGG